jgi:NADPH2:quinone reductase
LFWRRGGAALPPKPTSLNFAEAAALPLTAITAELLFDRSVKRGEIDVRCWSSAARAVLARSRSSWHASSRACCDPSRLEAEPRVREGAHHVIDHCGELAAGSRASAFPAVDIVVALTGTARHAGEVGLIARQGH